VLELLCGHLGERARFHDVPAERHADQLRRRQLDPRLGRRRDESSFTCTVETTMPSVINFLARATGVLWALRRHVAEETLGYAADLTRKLQAKANKLTTSRG
jgi:hypothetical protein